MRKITECTWEGCSEIGRYALYQLFESGKKIWRTDLCDEHEKLIVRSNAGIQQRLNGWRNPKIKNSRDWPYNNQPPTLYYPR